MKMVSSKLNFCVLQIARKMLANTNGTAARDMKSTNDAEATL